jgi:Rrf2 family protein
MKVSSKSRYALMARVALDLRTRGHGRPVRLVDLAAERRIPEQYLEQLFASLRRAGLVTGHRGAGGGFTFARRPDRLSVLDIVEALDGPPLSGQSPQDEFDSDERAAAGVVWRAAGVAYQDVLAHTTISDLAERERQLGGGPMYEI